MRKAFWILCLGLACQVGAGELASNTQLKTLKEQDQAVRKDKKNIDWKKVGEEDEARRNEVYEMLRRGEVHTAQDYYNAALIYQHGQSADDYRVAYSLASMARALNPEHPLYKWLSAAAWDRMLLKIGKPQWYATQFDRDQVTGKISLAQVDEQAVSDEERKDLVGRTLQESRGKEVEMNKR